MLPFDQEVEIRKSPDGEVLGVVDGHIERAPSPGETQRGERYDWTGQLHLDAADPLLGQANREVIVNDTRYRVVDSIEYLAVPHIAVALLELRPGG